MASANTSGAEASKNWHSPAGTGIDSSLATRSSTDLSASLTLDWEDFSGTGVVVNDSVTVHIESPNLVQDLSLSDDYLNLIDGQFQSVRHCSGGEISLEDHSDQNLRIHLYDEMVPCNGDAVYGCYQHQENRILIPYSSMLSLRHELVHYFQDILDRDFGHDDPLFDSCFTGVQNLTIRLQNGDYVDAIYEPANSDEFPPVSVFDNYQQIFEGLLTTGRV